MEYIYDDLYFLLTYMIFQNFWDLIYFFMLVKLLCLFT